MKIQLLGTAAAEGWPAIYCNCTHCQRAWELGGKNIRTRSGALIDDRYKIDFGPDTYHHVLTHGIQLSKVEHLIFTHSHSDHLALTDVIRRFPPYAHMGGDDPETLHIWGNETVVDNIRQGLGARLEKYRRVELHRLEAFRPTTIGDIVVTPLLADHDQAEECFIYIIESGDKRLLYGHDTGMFPEKTWEYLSVSTGEADQTQGEPIRLDLVILDCTNGPIKQSRNHMGIDANIEVKRRLTQLGCADDKTIFVATHFSHNGGLLHDELIDVFAPNGFIVAYDGIVLDV